MSSTVIKRVTDSKSLDTFIQFHYDLYRGNPYDAPNLYMDEKNTLSKDKNAAFDFCEAEYFLAYKDGKVVGRVAAIINNRANETWNSKAVRFGWIDFIDDIEVSKALLDAVEKWGKEKEMNMIQGPLGFTDMDPEGMLTFGFDQLGTMATIYNYDYYPKHMEQLGGFVKDNDYVEFKIIVPKTIPEKYGKIADMIKTRYNLHVKKLTKDDIYKRGYGRKIFDVINKTFTGLYGYSQMTERQMDQYVDMYFPMADLSLITVIEDRNDNNNVIAVGITIPSLSKAVQKCRNGRLFPFGWYHVLRALKFHKTKGVDLLLIGVLPEYRQKGANALIFNDIIPRCQAYGFEWAETQVEMESNDKVQSQWQYVEKNLHKRRRCYKKDI